MRRREKGSVIAPEKRKYFFKPLSRKAEFAFRIPTPSDSSNFALATIASEKIPSVSPCGYHTFHTFHGYVNEKLLRSTAKQFGVVLEGYLRECEECSVPKGLGKPIGRTTSTRADKAFRRLFVDICGEKSFESIGEKRYMLLICDNFSPSTWTYFMRQKSDTVALCEQFLATNEWQEPPQQ